MMVESLSSMVTIAGAIFLVLLLIVLLWLIREHRNLKRQCQALSEQIQRGSIDVAGLCSAAVAVDRRLAASESRLEDLIGFVGDLAAQPKPQPDAPVAERVPIHDPAPAQGYDQVIEKIRRGADVEELVKNCGLTRDEAMLLVRLHGR